ncbi:MAG: dihydroorotate dehydrogenase electron transfer subunit [Abitibacteriaceae bacterium]|nr:dihydroorotate dehydrogenase electron transfer subunit [Abditibacteriaceae bacterium]MBV9867206.1 dihydroorotate dehydrogenase electron transfer subunit [Abditibacteriaceae bacterium]
MPQRILAQIIEQRELTPSHYRLRLAAPEIAQTAKAGQYVHVLPRATHSFDPLLRRAFSIMRAAEDAIDILYRIEGRGTALLARRKAGETIDVLGPLGLPFAPLTTHNILVGGGVGVPPLVLLAAQAVPEVRIQALIGARAATEIIGQEDFRDYDVPVEVATDDGSAGHQGLVTDLLERQLSQSGLTGQGLTVFACGPLPMLRVVAAMSQRYKVPCQVSLEENMPCGVGVCNGCVVPVLGAGDDYGNYRRICVDGPVLWANEVNWGHYSGDSC